MANSPTDWPAAIGNLPPLREVIAALGLTATRKLGQNFLLDLNVTDKIARAAGDLTGCDVIEIGPGPGGLTRALLGRGARRVIAIERDARCIVALQPLVEAAAGRLNLIEGDAMAINPVDVSQGPRCIIANLPYNIATPLLIGWLKQADKFASLTLMFQHEVAARIVAKAGTKDYGRLSVLAQAITEARIALKLPPQAFTPPPKVHSSVVHLVPRAVPLAPAEKLEKITAVAFGQRRKMIRGTLLPMVGAEALENAGILPTQRAEEITVEQFASLANGHIVAP